MRMRSLVVVGIVFLLVVGLASAAVLNYYGKIAGNFNVLTNPNIVLWLPFNEGSGCTADDISQYNNHGTLKPTCPTDSPTWTSGKIGNALSFDGTNDYVEVPDSDNLDVSNEITVEVWLKTSASQDNGDGIIVKGTPFTYLLQAWDGKINPGVFISDGTWCGSGWLSTKSVFDGSWHHLALTFDGTDQKFYIDGILDTTKACSGQIRTNDANLYLGWRPDGNYYFNGIIDEPRIWNIALTSDQIQSIYQKGVGG